MANANATCYFPDGGIDFFGQSCNPSDAVSHCCASSHLCLSSSLCWDTAYNHIIRASCTDASWLSDDCPQHCKDDTSTTYGDMRECPGQINVWTCGLDPSNCTNTFSLPTGYIDDNREWKLGAIVALPSPYTVLASATGSATVTTTVLATVTTTSPPTSSPISKNDNAATVGLSTGLGIGVPLLVALCVSLWLLYRARKKIRALGSVHQSARSEFPKPGDPRKWQATQEIDSRYIHEVPGSKP